jgi:signal recognition particle receptor subunit beta
LATSVDRTLFFDFLPVKLPRIKGFTIRMSLYTVPGQVHYNATRKMVLIGADGVVFVADSQPSRREANLESLENLEDNLRGHGMNPNTIPLVFQYNKRDLPNAMPVEQLEEDLNSRSVPSFETCALDGTGIMDTLKSVTKAVLSDLRHKGIYKESKPKTGPSLDRTPVVSRKVQEGIVEALETHMGLQGPPELEPWAPGGPARSPEGKSSQGPEPATAAERQTDAVTEPGAGPDPNAVTELVEPSPEPEESSSAELPGLEIDADATPPSGTPIPPELRSQAIRPDRVRGEDTRARLDTGAVLESGRGSDLDSETAKPHSEVVARGLTFSELWTSTHIQDQILAAEGEIERGDYTAAVRRAEGLLREYVSETSNGQSVVEALLMAGVHGPYYVRFKQAVGRDHPSKQDALFCLFFLADLEMRLQGGPSPKTSPGFASGAGSSHS